MAKMNEFPLLKEEEGIPLFYPHIPKNASQYVTEVLSTRWIGQGPKVEEFEYKFSKMFHLEDRCVSVNSGTAALHLAYLLSGVSLNSEVLCPVFTCTATNLPILHQQAIPRFVDVGPDSLNINIQGLEDRITDRTVAISVVDYGGLPNDYVALRDLCDKYNLKLIADCAHSVDGRFNGRPVADYADYVVYSFQAIKTMTTGDGGILVVSNREDYDKARRLRWFGIDRDKKQKGNWENDLLEVGYKYHMNDIAAAIGIASLEELSDSLIMRKNLYTAYIKELEEFSIDIFENKSNSTDIEFTPWLITLNTHGRREALMHHLRSKGIESAQVHYRNDQYSVFKPFVDRSFPNMDKIANEYLVLPLHTKMSVTDVEAICYEVKSFLR